MIHSIILTLLFRSSRYCAYSNTTAFFCSYQKFTRAKDMTNYTANDRAAVLGIGLSRSKEENPEKAKPSEVKVEEVESNSAGEKSNTTVSTLSVAEYFASKMAALKAKREQVEDGAQVRL